MRTICSFVQVLICFLYCVVILGCSNDATEVKDNTDIEVDLGTIVAAKGKKVSHTFKLHNQSQKTITITNTLLSCSCTLSNWDKKIIPPNDFANLKLEVSLPVKEIRNRVLAQVEVDNQKDKRRTFAFTYNSVKEGSLFPEKLSIRKEDFDDTGFSTKVITAFTNFSGQIVPQDEGCKFDKSFFYDVKLIGSQQKNESNGIISVKSKMLVTINRANLIVNAGVSKLTSIKLMGKDHDLIIEFEKMNPLSLYPSTLSFGKVNSKSAVSKSLCLISSEPLSDLTISSQSKEIIIDQKEVCQVEANKPLVIHVQFVPLLGNHFKQNTVTHGTIRFSLSNGWSHSITWTAFEEGGLE